MLCGYHAKSIDMCEWVLNNTDPNSTNLTVQLWRKACKDFITEISTVGSTDRQD